MGGVYGTVKFWNASDTKREFLSHVHTKHMKSQEGVITVAIRLHGLLPGFHGIHIHEYGDLSQDNTNRDTSEKKQECCENVCLHYNPTRAQHGSFRLHGLNCHAGDLCNNVLANKQGDATYVFQYIPGHNKMFEIEDILGRSIVVHANKDDLGVNREEDPDGSGKTGNAGAKLACAVIGRMKSLLTQQQEQNKE